MKSYLLFLLYNEFFLCSELVPLCTFYFSEPNDSLPYTKVLPICAFSLFSNSRALFFLSWKGPFFLKTSPAVCHVSPQNQNQWIATYPSPFFFCLIRGHSLLSHQPRDCSCRGPNCFCRYWTTVL